MINRVELKKKFTFRKLCNFLNQPFPPLYVSDRLKKIPLVIKYSQEFLCFIVANFLPDNIYVEIRAKMPFARKGERENRCSPRVVLSACKHSSAFYFPRWSELNYSNLVNLSVRLAPLSRGSRWAQSSLTYCELLIADKFTQVHTPLCNFIERAPLLLRAHLLFKPSLPNWNLIQLFLHQLQNEGFCSTCC